MENFEKTIKNSPPFVERTIISDGTKGSFKSKLIVRLQYFGRKLFPRSEFKEAVAGAALEPAIPRLSKEKPFEFFA